MSKERQHENAEKVLEEAIKIATLIVDGRRAVDAVELVSILTSIVFRTVIAPEHFDRAVEIHYKLLKSSPTKSPIKGELIPDTDKQH